MCRNRPPSIGRSVTSCKRSCSRPATSAPPSCRCCSPYRPVSEPGLALFRHRARRAAPLRQPAVAGSVARRNGREPHGRDFSCGGAHDRHGQHARGRRRRRSHQALLRELPDLQARRGGARLRRGGGIKRHARGNGRGGGSRDRAPAHLRAAPVELVDLVARRRLGHDHRDAADTLLEHAEPGRLVAAEDSGSDFFRGAAAPRRAGRLPARRRFRVPFPPHVPDRPVHRVGGVPLRPARGHHGDCRGVLLRDVGRVRALLRRDLHQRIAAHTARLQQHGGRNGSRAVRGAQRARSRHAGDPRAPRRARDPRRGAHPGARVANEELQKDMAERRRMEEALRDAMRRRKKRARRNPSFSRACRTSCARR